MAASRTIAAQQAGVCAEAALLPNVQANDSVAQDH